MPKKLPKFTESLPYLIEEIAIYLELHGKVFFEKIAGNIITAEECRTLHVIEDNPDICQRDLARLILRDRVRTGRILDSLEGKGFIHRYGDLKNKRLVKKMKLTEQGKILFADIENKLKPYVDIMRDEFTEKQSQELKELLYSLKSVLSKIVEVPA